MQRLMVFVLLAAAVVGGWYVASPWLAMDGLKDAALAVDRAELEQRVDFDAVRTSLKDDLHGRIADATSDQSAAVQILGGAIATGLGDMAVDAAVTPAGVAGIITTGRLAAPLAQQEAGRSKLDWSIDRGGFNSFIAASRFEDGSAGPTLHFARDGVSWKLVAIDLPAGRR